MFVADDSTGRRKTLTAVNRGMIDLMEVSKLPVMEYVPPCPLSLKGILYQSLQSPHLLPLPPPSLGPRGQGCPWVDPS